MNSQHESLLKQRTRRAISIQERDGLKEGMYRVREAARQRWYMVWLEFYPEERWMVKEISGPVELVEIEATRRALDDELKSKLEGWL